MQFLPSFNPGKIILPAPINELWPKYVFFEINSLLCDLFNLRL